MKIDYTKEDEIIEANAIINDLQDNFYVKKYLEAVKIVNSCYAYVQNIRDEPIFFRNINNRDYFLIPPERIFDMTKNKFSSTGWNYMYYDTDKKSSTYGCIGLANYNQHEVVNIILKHEEILG